MTLYHGSPTGNLTQLKPFLSEHGKEYVYFSSNPLVALLYAVKPVPKPFSFYPYGFDRNGIVVYSEYFENAFEIFYKGKAGYLYECDNIPKAEQPTQISCAFTCDFTVKPDRVRRVDDLYEYFKEKEREGLFKIRPCKDISEKEMQFVFDDLMKSMKKTNPIIL